MSAAGSDYSVIVISTAADQQYNQAEPGHLQDVPNDSLNATTSSAIQEPRQPINQVATATTTANTNNNQTAEPRIGPINRFRSLSRAYKIGMILQAVISATTSITTIIILALSGSEQCSAPLDVFLSVCLILLLINLSISIHRYLYPQPLNDRMQRQGCVAEIKWYVDVLSAVWFVLGNYWLFASTECTRTAPMRFYMSLYYIIIGYAMIMLPVFMICSILLCMPFVWICLRTLQNVLGVQIEPRMQNAIINPFSRVRGLASAQINRIPAFEFGGDKHSATSDYANLTLTGEDAICSICLIEYTAGERLKSLPGCQHHFHADCVDQWLLINKTCPLCVRDVEIELSLKPTSRNEIECV